ncbi:MAG TPA: glycosyltransferase family 9 protein [Candidatus Omnitrophota bacterium]|nr:glycosyltransferase family 9 protein [Candidatus Omnitrophota bacterium]
MKRILIVQPFGIGDSLFVTPLIRTLKERGMAERVDMLLGSRTREVFERNPLIDRIFVIDRDKLKRQGLFRTFFEIGGLIFRLLKIRYHVLIDCSLSREYAFFARFFLAIPERIGFDYKKRGIFLSRKLSLPAGFSGKPVAEHYAELLRFLEITEVDCHPQFFFRAEDDTRRGKILSDCGIREGEAYIAVVPGGGDSWGKDASFKRWPPVFFAQVLNAFRSRFPAKMVIVLGSGGEFRLGEELLEAYEGKGVNLCGKISLVDSAAVLKGARYLLANDSGMVHIARSLDVPCVAIYGPVDEKVYGPYPRGPAYLAIGRSDLDCRPCYKNFRYHSNCLHRSCLRELSPAEVIQRVYQSDFFSVVSSRKS